MQLAVHLLFPHSLYYAGEWHGRKLSLYGFEAWYFVTLVKFIEIKPVSKNLESKLAQLETLYAEQDYTIQTLNDMVAQQDQEISQLNLSIEQIKQQLHMLKSELSPEIYAEIEIPPHY